MKATINLISEDKDRFREKYIELEINHTSDLFSKNIIIQFLKDDEELIKKFSSKEDNSIPTFIPDLLDINLKNLKTLFDHKNVLEKTLDVYENKDVFDKCLKNKFKNLFKYNKNILENEYFKTIENAYLMKEDIEILNEFLKEDYFNVNRLILSNKTNHIVDLIESNNGFNFTDIRKKIIDIKFCENILFENSIKSFYIMFRNNTNIKMYFEELENKEFICYLYNKKLYDEYSFRLESIREVSKIIQNFEKFNTIDFNKFPKYQPLDEERILLIYNFLETK